MILKRIMSDADGEKLRGTFLKENNVKILVNSDCDGYSTEGELLFKFRKSVMPFDKLKLGYESFKGSIQKTEGRGMAAGKPFKRILKTGERAGQESNTTISNFVDSGNVGFMDKPASGRNAFCRKTAFAREYFDKFKAGIPFVQEVDRLYKELCPEHYKRQEAIARGTNRNYVIGNTAFTTVTVNRNFQTAVHKDSGDFVNGFGNLCVYREGSFDGAYFCLPEFGVGIDMQNTDMLFVDVHRWHANTPFFNCSSDYLRVSFVMYYRENMILCKQPSEELRAIKIERGGLGKL